MVTLERVVLPSFQAFSSLEVFTSSSFRHWPSTCQLRRFRLAFASEHLPRSLTLHHHQAPSAMKVAMAKMATSHFLLLDYCRKVLRCVKNHASAQVVSPSQQASA